MTEPLFPLLSVTRLRMSIDGAGVTTLVAGAGCPLRCRWCINRELLQRATAEPVTAQKLLDRVKIDDLYFLATGGGITFGGGEALLHAVFLRRFRELCPDRWHIRAETSLAVPEEQIRIAADAVDEFIVDCKDMDPGIYHRYTGGEQQIMEKNLRLLLELAGAERILVRVPLIPGYNTEDDREKSAAALRALGVHHLDLFEYILRGQEAPETD